MKCRLFWLILLISSCGYSQQRAHPVPSKFQLAWHEKEFYLFMHFGPNTFTDREWGEGTEPASVFNPVNLDCRQWCKVAKQAGAAGIIITAKHHDGFCLWPSKYSTHTVRESKWKNGKGDVLKELSVACREAGLKFGVYISPWDRNHPDYGTEKYNDVFVGMMKELFKNYGPIWELWWDGANGEGPNGKKQVYDWRRFETTVRKISPSTVIFSDIGPDIRWVGNEKGFAGDPNWNYLDTAGFKRGLGAPPEDTLNHGNYAGANWIPAECDVSIRPGWFWHAGEDEKVKPPSALFDLWLKSVGRGANLLLNVPPANTGLISDKDIQVLKEFKQMRDNNFSVNLLKDARTNYRVDPKDDELWDDGETFKARNQRDIDVWLPNETLVNCIVLKEAIHEGQHVRKFSIGLYNGSEPVGTIKGSSIGRKRILTFPGRLITSFHIILEETAGKENVRAIGAYHIDELLVK
jgi:alpha-L-fucosidase